MDFGKALDVAIGLFLMYLLLSLFVTSLNEAVASVLDLRGKSLEGGLKLLLTNPDSQKIEQNLFDKFAGTSSYKLLAGMSDSKGQQRPPYLDAGQFCDIVHEMLEAEDKAGGQALTQRVENLPDSFLKSKLQTIARTVDGDVTKFSSAVSNWYDSTMTRLSGSYVKLAQRNSLIFGLAIAFIVQADTVQVAEYLWRNDKARAELVQTAIQTTVMAAPASPTTTQPTTTNDATLDNALSKVQAAKQSYDELTHVPIGWHGKFDRYERLKQKNGGIGWWLLWLVLDGAIGILITGFAVSMGAPFWFDLLKRVANIRSAGPNPAEQQQAKQST